MAYASMENAIILKGTRHGLLASVREDADWREVLKELAGLTAQNSQFLKDAQLVLDFGWREVTEEQFDAIIVVIKEQGLGCNGILSTSLNTRTIAESRGYRAIIGRLGLAQHQGRRLRQEITPQPPAPAPEPVAVAEAVVAPEPVPAASVETFATAVDEQAVVTAPVLECVPAPPPAPVLKSEDSLEIAAPAEVEPSVEEDSAPFDSADPIIAALPAVFDSSEGSRSFSSSEPGIHVPHYQDEEPTLYIRKTLRSGQRVVFAGNVVLLGDLNPGAQIEADGDVIVLGQLRGSVHAGCEGDKEATVVTSSMRATQLRIADRFYKADQGSRFFKKTPPSGTLRARLDGENVVVEALPVR